MRDRGSRGDDPRARLERRRGQGGDRQTRDRAEAEAAGARGRATSRRRAAPGPARSRAPVPGTARASSGGASSTSPAMGPATVNTAAAIPIISGITNTQGIARRCSRIPATRSGPRSRRRAARGEVVTGVDQLVVDAGHQGDGAAADSGHRLDHADEERRAGGCPAGCGAEAARVRPAVSAGVSRGVRGGIGHGDSLRSLHPHRRGARCCEWASSPALPACTGSAAAAPVRGHVPGDPGVVGLVGPGLRRVLGDAVREDRPALLCGGLPLPLL